MKTVRKAPPGAICPDMKTGVLLTNIGSPDSPCVADVRRYLREFLSDGRVILLPRWLRFLLLNGVILPFRSRQSARAYRKIWREDGSPLLHHSRQFQQQLQMKLGDAYQVVIGMRYGKPNITQALSSLQGCERLVILPLYPQYSSAATGSALEMVLHGLAKQVVMPSLEVIRDFHQHTGFIQAQAALIQPYLAQHEHVLFSYHGLPENHVLQGECKLLCKLACSAQSIHNPGCYRAQSARTTALLVEALGLDESRYSHAFQSRLGKTPWIKPHTDEVLQELAARGIKRLAITCPSFVADCLETLEEIGLRAQAQWSALGGEKLTLVPCLNESVLWVEAVYHMVNDAF